MRRQSAVQETGSDHILLWPLTAQLGAAAASSGRAADIQAHTLVSHNPLCVCVCAGGSVGCANITAPNPDAVCLSSLFEMSNPVSGS